MKCPVCDKEYEQLVNHISNSKDDLHKEFLSEGFKLLRSYIHLPYYSGDLMELFFQEHPYYRGIISSGHVSKMRKEEYGSSWYIVRECRTGKKNPVNKNKKTKERISDTVKKRWQEGNYDNRINGMLGKHSARYNPENYTKVHLAKTEYREFLSNFQSIDICNRCGSIDKKMNIHHIDENHDNFLISNLEPLCVGCHILYHNGSVRLPYVTIAKRFDFEASHFLPHYDGDCAELHGHRWELEVGIRKRIDPKTKMVMDFKVMKDICKKHIVDVLDHSLINTKITNPTSEMIIIWIWERLMFDALLKGIEYIKLNETANSTTIIDKDGMLSQFTSNLEKYHSD